MTTYALLTDILGTQTTRLPSLIPKVINPQGLTDDELASWGVARVEVTRPSVQWWQTLGTPVVDDTVRPVTVVYPVIERSTAEVRGLAAGRVERDEPASLERLAVLSRERIAAADTTAVPVRIDGVTTWMTPADALAHARAEIEAAVMDDLVAWVQADTAAEAVDLDAIVAAADTPDAWVQPVGSEDAYALDRLVMHNGNVWRSLVPANVWEPGVANWRNMTVPVVGYPAWVQPTGAGDAYQIGDRVTHNGSDWESVTADNVWEPGVFGWVAL